KRGVLARDRRDIVRLLAILAKHLARAHLRRGRSGLPTGVVSEARPGSHVDLSCRGRREPSPRGRRAPCHAMVNLPRRVDTDTDDVRTLSQVPFYELNARGTASPSNWSTEIDYIGPFICRRPARGRPAGPGGRARRRPWHDWRLPRTPRRRQ